uniref:RNase H type-1 domain-containing protein n=1 Tax=Brassica oleracea var. oleracea TaxID=109376 RepID=A0A0D2ZQW6_BRAOL
MSRMLKLTWKTSRFYEEASSTQTSSMFPERRTKERIDWHVVLGNNRLSSFIWMRSCRFGLQNIKILRRSFLNSDIIHVPRTENQRADRLARSARKQPSFVVHMDAELPIWFTESI